VNYSAAKAGIIVQLKPWVRISKRNITVNCVAPGLIETDMVHELPLEEIKTNDSSTAHRNPIEVAAAVAFFMSEDASYITRQVLSVNGGLC